MYSYGKRSFNFRTKYSWNSTVMEVNIIHIVLSLEYPEVAVHHAQLVAVLNVNDGAEPSSSLLSSAIDLIGSDSLSSWGEDDGLLLQLLSLPYRKPLSPRLDG